MIEQIICPFCLSGIEVGQQECPFCNTSLQNRNPSGCLPLGIQLDGRYTIGSYLFMDGEGVMYKAVENQSRTFVVVKEYMPVTLCAGRAEDGNILPKEGSEVLFKTTRMDFSELYHTLQKLGKRSGLVQVKDVFEANESVYAVFEHLDGITLADYLEKRGHPLSAQEATNLLMPVMEGVALLHRHGIVHYGICTQNIRITSNGEAKLGGFGTMALRTAGGELKSQLFDGYAAPEQYFVEQFSGRFTDVYSMAAVLYCAVTGVEPASATERQVNDSLKPARSLNTHLPAYLSGVLQSALQMNPQNRLQTIAELIDVLDNPAKAKEIVNAEEKKKIPQGVWIGAAVAAGILILILLITTLLLRNPSDAPSETSSTSSTSASQSNSSKIPDFSGQKYADVYQNNSYTSKYLFRIKEEFSDTQAKGVIISQEPKAGTVTDEKEPLIILTVSKGPEKIAIPKVIGFTQNEAETELKAAGFGSVRVNHVDNNGEYAAGCVVSVSPNPGELTSPGQTVTINVAKVQPTPSPTPEPTPTPSPEPTPEPTIDSSIEPSEPTIDGGNLG